MSLGSAGERGSHVSGEVKKYLEDNIYLTLATICKNGQPWSSTMFFVYDENFVYWWLPKQAVHSQNILSGKSNAFITIFDMRKIICNIAGKVKSVALAGQFEPRHFAIMSVSGDEQ
jgi:uncharacterized protein YhbP (UPF0306 family)